VTQQDAMHSPAEKVFASTWLTSIFHKGEQAGHATQKISGWKDWNRLRVMISTRVTGEEERRRRKERVCFW